MRPPGAVAGMMAPAASDPDAAARLELVVKPALARMLDQLPEPRLIAPRTRWMLATGAVVFHLVILSVILLVEHAPNWRVPMMTVMVRIVPGSPRTAAVPLTQPRKTVRP